MDGKGRYTRELGAELEGKAVLREGQTTVLDLFRKHVLHAHNFTHSYPYDWRTHQVGEV